MTVNIRVREKAGKSIIQGQGKFIKFVSGLGTSKSLLKVSEKSCAIVDEHSSVGGGIQINNICYYCIFQYFLNHLDSSYLNNRVFMSTYRGTICKHRISNYQTSSSSET